MQPWTAIKFTPEVDVTGPAPPPLGDPCTELGRSTRAYVSGYNLSQVSQTRLRRFSKRCVVANFNGALAKGQLITSVRWDCTSPWASYMENARIITGQREVAVDVSFNFSGTAFLKATVTLDNGESYNQQFRFTVVDQPLYPGATYNNANGPYTLTASV